MHTLFLGGSESARRRAARAHVPASHTVFIVDTGTLPFVRPRDVELPPGARVLLLDDIERAFPDAQAGGTRLVLTQSTYLVQTWIDALAEGDRIIATADRAALERCAPESLQARGPWARFLIVEIAQTEETEETKDTKELVPFVSLARELARAYAASSPADRLRLCQDAVASEPASPVAWLALASACRETRDSRAAREALDRAAAVAPDWEAVHYESGKLWLALDDMPRARDAFQRAADRMPTFSAAYSNLGATLGELGETGAALAAFEHALAHDPRSVTLLNNVGVVRRELGRLDESEAALRRVVAIAPEFVFGHYNLGHTLFLAGRYREALDAYEEGQRRDPENNRRQGCRLAMMRFATGDPAGAERDLWRAANAAPPDEREDLLLEAYEIAQALAARHPALAGGQAFLDRLGAEIVKSE